MTVVHDEQVMVKSYVLKKSPTSVSFTTHLKPEQLEALMRCASGISLRFDARAIVNALVDGGFAKRTAGGVVTVTVKGEEYLRTYAN